MNPLAELLRQPAALALGWTLLHFVWQGALLAAAYALVRTALRRYSANARYLAGCATLLLMAAAVVLTFGQFDLRPGLPVLSERLPGAAAIASASAAISPMASTTHPRLTESLTGLAELALPWLTAFWLAGVGVLSLRMVASWWQVRNLRHQSGLPLEARLGARLIALQARLRVSRPVRLIQSAAVQVPTVIGWLRPVILLPASALTGLSPQQLDFILAHELAHVRRGDSWVNLLQVLLETLLFYHPAVWWVSRCVREEREHCCDDLALAACGDALAGAHALATLEELRHVPAQLALAASDGSLLGRVRRLLGLPAEDADWRRPLGNALIGLGLILILAGAVAFGSTNQYQAVCRIAPESGRMSFPRPDPLLSREFRNDIIGTELQMLQSRYVLSLAANRLRDSTYWVRYFNAGKVAFNNEEFLAEKAYLAQAVPRLRRQIEVRQVHSTSLIEIQAVADDATEARDIANAVAEAYRNYCAKDKAERLRSGLTVLQQNLDQQTARVRELGQRLEETRTRLGLEGWTDETADLNRSVEREQLSSLTQMATQAQSDYVLWSTKLSGLEKIGPDQLPNVILTAVDREELLPRLLGDLQTVEQNLVKLRIDQADESPEVKRTLAIQSRIKEQINERVAGIMAGLSNQVMSMRERCDALARNLNENQKRVAEQNQAWREYRQLRRDLDNEQRVRDALQLRLLQEQVDAEIPNRATVEIVDPAVLPLRPVRSASTLGGGLMGSGLLSFLAGLTLRFTARKPPAVA